MCPEPVSRLRENQNKGKDLFLEIASSQRFSCNPSSKQEFYSSGEIDLRFLITDIHLQKQLPRNVPWN